MAEHLTPTRDAERTAHEVRVRASADDVHRMLADEDAWPRVFASFVHLENLGRDGEWDRMGMWALSGEEVEHWVALRRVDDAARRVEFRPEHLPPSLASMLRSWVTEPAADGGCTVRLEHAFLVDGDRAAADEVRSRVEGIARAETEAVREAAELLAACPEALVTVEDSVTVAASAEQVYEALYDGGSWPSYMDHVARTDVTGTGGSGGPHTHVLEMETIERHGGRFTTRAARAGLPHRGIAYKQLLLPPLGASHHVRWSIEEGAGGTSVVSRQTVVIKESGVAAVLGPDTPLAAVRDFVRTELSSKVRLIFDAVRNRLEKDVQ